MTDATPSNAVHDLGRLAVLARTGLLDAGPDHTLDRLSRLATRVLRVPIALVSLVDPQRQYFAGASGLPEPYDTGRETPLITSYCQHVVASRQPLIVTDARRDDRVRAIPLLDGLPIAGYAGFPVTTDDGHVLGSFCAIDDQPREWVAEELEVLADLAAAASTEIRLRLAIAGVQAELAAREAAEAALEAARQVDADERRAVEQRQQEFLDDIAHDLRNPLAAVKGQAQLMLRQMARRGTVEPDRLRTGLHGIEASAEQMTAQIAELQDIARLRSGQPLALDATPTDLTALVSEAVAAARQLSTTHTIVMQLEDSAVIARLDALRLRRVVDNILTNAVTYSPNGGTVSVTMAAVGGPDGSWTTISVQDEGVGIPANELGRIFERYRRGSNVAGRFRGTGIGLAGARQIVEQHGGTIVVSSEEGRGTLVTVSLPRSVPEAQISVGGEPPDHRSVHP